MESRELKRLVEKFSIERLDSCIREQLEKGENTCEIRDSTDEVIAELSKATVVRDLMDKGMNFPEALRELGKRIRAIYYKDHTPP